MIGGRLGIQGQPTTLNTFRNITSAGSSPFRINEIASNISHARVGNTARSNAVLPAWRGSLCTTNMDVYFDADASMAVIRQLEAEMNEKQDPLKGLTPGSGAYVNEATFDNPEWKRDY